LGARPLFGFSLYATRAAPAYKRCLISARNARPGGHCSMPLKITVRSVQAVRETGDIMVVLTPLLGGRAKKNQRTPLDGFDRALGGALGRLIKKEDFK